MITKTARTRTAAVCLLAATATTVAGCGSSGNNGSSGGGTMSLKLGVPGATTSAAPFALAQAAGLFKKNGLSVSIENKGALAPSQVAAGQLDLTQYGTGAAFAPQAAGRNTSIIYALGGNSTGAVEVSAKSSITPKASTEATLMQLSGKRVGVQGTGGSSYGNASAISKYVTSHGGKALKLVPLQDYASMSAQLISGQLDATVVFSNPFLEAIAQKKMRVLVPSTDPGLAKIEGGSFPALAVFGLTKHLKTMRKAVTAFIKSVQQAYDLMSTGTLTSIATQLHTTSLFSALPVDNLVAQMTLDRPFWRPDNGRITEQSWSTTLKALSNWGLPQNLTSSKFSYSSIVDMSYYDAASKS